MSRTIRVCFPLLAAPLALAACADLIGVDGWEPGRDGASGGSSASSTSVASSTTSTMSTSTTSGTGGGSTSSSGPGGEGGGCGTGGEGGGAPPSTELWAKKFGDSEIQQPRGIAVSPGGSILLAGFFRGEFGFGGPTLQNPDAHDDGFLAHFDGDGDFVASGEFGDAASDQTAHGVAWTSGNAIAAVGYYAGVMGFATLEPLPAADGVDGFLALFDADSNPASSTAIGGASNQRALHVAALASNELVVTGDYDADATATPLAMAVEHVSLTDSFVLRYSSVGDALKATTITGSGSQHIRALAIGPGDVIYVAGHYDSELIVDGVDIAEATGGLDAFVVKLDPGGAVVRIFGGPEDQVVTAMTIDTTGRVIVAGTFEGESTFPGGPLTSQSESDAFVVAFDEALAPLWTSVLGGPGQQIPCGVGTTGNGEVILAGSFEGSIDSLNPVLESRGDLDVFVARLSDAGTPQSGWQFGDCRAQVCDAAVVDVDDDLLLTGHFTGTIDFGGTPLESDGNVAPDIFLAKIDP